MNLVEYCDICGQQLTDASGRWTISFVDHGIHHFPPVKGRCCAYCQDKVLEAIEKLSEERRKERDSR